MTRRRPPDTQTTRIRLYATRAFRRMQNARRHTDSGVGRYNSIPRQQYNTAIAVVVQYVVVYSIRRTPSTRRRRGKTFRAFFATPRLPPPPPPPPRRSIVHRCGGRTLCIAHTRCSPPVRSHRRSYPIISHILDTTPTAMCVYKNYVYLRYFHTYTHTRAVLLIFFPLVFVLANKCSPYHPLISTVQVQIE